MFLKRVLLSYQILLLTQYKVSDDFLLYEWKIDFPELRGQNEIP